MLSRFVGLPGVLGPRLQPRDGRGLPGDVFALLLGGLLPLGCSQYDPWPSLGGGLSAAQPSRVALSAAFYCVLLTPLWLFFFFFAVSGKEVVGGHCGVDVNASGVASA